jgi:hypothetical protein
MPRAILCIGPFIRNGIKDNGLVPMFSEFPIVCKWSPIIDFRENLNTVYKLMANTSRRQMSQPGFPALMDAPDDLPTNFIPGPK